MSISIQCCGLAILLVILYYMLSQKRLSLRTQKAYLLLWGSVFAHTIIDIVLSTGLYGSNPVPSFLQVFGCLYNITAIAVSLFAIIYQIQDLFHSVAYRKKIETVFNIAFLSYAITVVFIPIRFVPKGNHLALTGPNVVFTYVVVGVNMAAILSLTIAHRKVLAARRIVALSISVFLLGIAIIPNFVFDNINVTSFTCTVGLLIIFLNLENPINNIDLASGLFNYDSLLLYCKERVRQNEPTYLLCVGLDNGHMERIPSVKRREVRTNINRYLSSITKGKAFQLFENQSIIAYTSKKQAEESYNALIDRFKNSWDTDGEIFLTPTLIGIPFSELDIRIEDVSMYVLKSKPFMKGKQLFMDRAFLDSLQHEKDVERDINNALDEDRVEVFFQPIYSVPEKRFISAEALVRIRRPDGSISFPGDFIDVAERTGQILRLGERVFEKVCHFISEHDLDRLGLSYIEINLSVIQCAHIYLAKTFADIMSRYRIDPHKINLEITESATLADKETLLQNINSLKALGVTFSLDDFGTGQSNLNYIVDIPVDIVKFDRDMTNSFFENDRARYVMEMAVQMIHGMNLTVVSEGVETKSQFEQMQNLEIDYIQGYYFSKPVDQRAFLSLIENSLYANV